MVAMVGRMRMTSVGSRSVSYSIKARARSTGLAVDSAILTNPLLRVFQTLQVSMCSF